MTKMIPLTQGRSAIVDDEDFERFGHLKWHLSSGYAARKNKTEGKIYLHRLILNTPSSMEVDHINGDELDNRRCNLRLSTSSGNKYNRVKVSYAGRKLTSDFKGVSRMRSGKWRAQGSVNGQTIPIGIFADEIDAALAYDDFARKHYGPFARINFEQGN